VSAHEEARVLAIRKGPGANCSSIGSVVDLLFGAAVLSAAVYAAVVASLADRPVRRVGRPSRARGEEK